MNNERFPLDAYDMGALIELYPAPCPPVRRDVIPGVVIAKSGNGYFVDIGQRSESFVTDADTLEIGETYFFFVLSPEPDEVGAIPVSYRRGMSWDRLTHLTETGETTSVKVRSVAKSKKTGRVAGLYAYIEGIRGFVPRSQVLHVFDSLEELIGTEIPVKVIETDPRINSVVLSQKSAIEEARASALAYIKRGETLPGTVVKVIDVGVLVDLGDHLIGLVHRTEVPGGPDALIKVGDEITVKVLRVHPERGRVSLSMRQS